MQRRLSANARRVAREADRTAPPSRKGIDRWKLTPDRETSRVPRFSFSSTCDENSPDGPKTPDQEVRSAERAIVPPFPAPAAAYPYDAAQAAAPPTRPRRRLLSAGHVPLPYRLPPARVLCLFHVVGVCEMVVRSDSGFGRIG